MSPLTLQRQRSITPCITDRDPLPDSSSDKDPGSPRVSEGTPPLTQVTERGGSFRDRSQNQGMLKMNCFLETLLAMTFGSFIFECVACVLSTCNISFAKRAELQQWAKAGTYRKELQTSAFNSNLIQYYSTWANRHPRKLVWWKHANVSLIWCFSLKQ